MFNLTPAAVPTVPDGSAMSRHVMLADLAKRGRSIIGYVTCGSMTWEGFTVAEATVYGRGPIDRSMIVQTDDGEVTFYSCDGGWQDSQGIDLAPHDNSFLDRAWQEATGHAD